MPGANFFSSMRSGGQIYGGPLPTIESKRLSQSLAPAAPLPPMLLQIQKAPGPVLYKPRFSWATLVLDWTFQTSDLFIVVVDTNQKQGNSYMVVWSASGPNTKDPQTGKPFVGNYWPYEKMTQLGPMLTEDEIHQTGLGAVPGLGEIPMDQGLAAITDAYWLMNSRSPYLLPGIDQNPPLPAWSPGEAWGAVASSRSFVPGCYEITGTSVNLRDPNNINQVIGGLNFPDQVQANGVTQNFYVPQGNVSVLHTFARVVVSSGPFRDTNGWVAVDYLRGCSRPAMVDAPSPWGQYTYADAWRRARMEQALPANQPRFPWRRPPPYQWGPLGLHGVPGEETMTMQAHDPQLTAGLGALLLSLDQGLGILGPYGAVPTTAIPAGTYEITGTQVALRATPGGNETGRFNNKYGANNNLVVEPADQVDFNGQVGNQGGLSWAQVTVKSGELAGSSGYVAAEYMAPVGWTKAHNGTGPIAGGGGGGGGGGGVIPAGNNTSTTTETDLTPWILGGAAVLGLGIIGWAALSKPKRGGAVRRSGRRRNRPARRRRARR